MRRHFKELLKAKWAEGKFVCVGLDSEVSKLPYHLRRSSDSLERIMRIFNESIIDATCDMVLAYKPNAAFYEAFGNSGWQVLEETVRTIHRLAPDVPVILDAKRADIGNTNNGYIKMAFDRLKVDAITVHPYLGGPDALKPFLDCDNKGIFVLCRTSNPGAWEFQDLTVSLQSEHFDEIYQGQLASEEHFTMERSMPLWKYVAHRVHGVWNRIGHNCGVVVGATYPEELTVVRKIVHDMPILIPGIGAQGGDVEKTVKAGITHNGDGIIVNSSRGIIFASSDRDYADAARTKTQELAAEIKKYLP